MAKIKKVRTRTVEELAKALGLTPAEGAEMVFRSNLNAQIITIVKKKKITHAQLAKLVGEFQNSHDSAFKPQYCRYFYRFDVEGVVSFRI